MVHAAKLDEFWFRLRFNGGQVPGHHRLLNDEERTRSPSPTLLEAKALYLRLKGVGRSKTFHMGADRAVDYLINASGNKPLLAYTKSDATTFRDALYDRNLSTSSVERVMSTIKAIVAFVLSESGITAPNPFSGVYLTRKEKSSDRKPIPPSDLRVIQAKCHEIDDDIRWLIALISDTGMRLAEAAGLAVSDLILNDPIPHVVIRPHIWRSLKTEASARAVPLVGHALWATKRIAESQNAGLAFPRYNRSACTNANSASASLNKWLAEKVPQGCVVHSFRHSLRDRLRVVECPSDIVDQIGGWRTAGEGVSYGTGYPLEVKERWLRKIT